ncbi:MAG TPA: efflux RND transporter periplasmic adaptor subunit [Candidatus Dormibacteraeota bacterium]|nr:efflux RND transporter periplasmic adaptor subunit [Candidatus Dormibacteraeota bacterium]
MKAAVARAPAKTMGMKLPIVAVAVLAIAGAGVFGASRLLASTPKVDFRTAAVQRGNVTQTVSVAGSVNASSQVHLNFKSGGRLAAVMVQTGQQVQPGDVLATLDDSDQKVAVQQAQSNLNAAQAKYNSVVSGLDLVPLRTSVDQAQQALDRLTAAYNAAKANLDTFNAAANNDRSAASISFAAAQTTLATLQNDLFLDIQYSDVHTAGVTASTVYQNLQQAQVPSTILDQALVDLGSAIAQLKTQIAAADAGHADVQAFAAAQVNFNAALSRVQSAFDGFSAPVGTALTNANSIIASLNTTTTKGATSLDQTRADATLLAQQLTATQQQIISAKSKASSLSTPLSTIADAITGSSLANARNSLTNAKQSLQTKLDSRNSDIQTALSSLQSAQSSLDNATNALANMSLTAPVAGVVTSVANSVGEYVSSASGGLITLSATNALTLHGTVGEADIANLKLAQVATITVDAIGTDKKLTGKVTSLDPVATLQQGVPVYGIDVTLDILDPAIRPGMTGTANVIVASKRDVLVVPNLAIRNIGGRRGVQVLLNGEAVDRTDVTFGVSNDQVTEVTGGLSEGDSVILPTARSTSSSNPQIRGLPGGGGGVQVGGGPGR